MLKKSGSSREGSLNSNPAVIGGGEMGERIRAFDWSETSLGPIVNWPQSFLSAVNIILQSPVPSIILWGTDGITLYNDAYSSFVSERHPKLLGIRYEEGWPEGAEFVRNNINTCFNGESLSFENYPFKIYRNNRTEDIWLNMNCSPVYNNYSGKVEAVLVTKVEVSAHVRATFALKESEERLRQVIEASNYGIWDYNYKKADIFWNDRMFEIFGYKSGEIDPGFDFVSSVVHPHDKTRLITAFNKTLKEGAPYALEYRVKHKHGHYIFIKAKGRAFFDESGNIYRVAGTATDVTRQKKDEEALRESEEKFHGIFSQTSVGIGLMDLSGKFMLVNQRFCEIVRRPAEELYKLTVKDVTHPEDYFSSLKLFEKAIEEAVPFIVEKRFVDAVGSEIWVNNNISCIRDKNGEPKYLLAVCQDISGRKKTEAALRESEERFRIMADAAPNMVWLLNAEGKVIYVNKFTFDFLGVSSEGFDFGALFSHVFPEDRPLVKESLSEAIENKRTFRNEHRLKRHDGIYRWILTQGGPSYYPNGELYGYVGTTIDITERKRAEEAFRKSEAKLKAVLDQLIEGVVITDAEGLIIFVNEAAEKLHGVKQFNISPDNYSEIYRLYKENGEVYPSNELPLSRAVLYDETILNARFKIKRKDGSEILAVGSAKPVFGPDNTKIGAVLTLRDETARVEAENSLRESEERFRTLADNISQLAWMADETGAIFWYNKRWFEFTGTGYEEIKGWGWQKVHHPDYVEDVLKKINYANTKGQEWEDTFPLRSRDGQYHWFLSRAIPLKDKNGKVFRWFGTHTDITDRKVAERSLELKNAELTRINNDLDNFIYTASHDLKAPISNIEGLMSALDQALEEECEIGEESGALISMIYESTNRFKKTIKDLAEVAKVESVGTEDVAQLSFKEVLEEVKINIKGEIEESGALITDDFSRVPLIYFSAKNLRSILYNLVSNAIKYRSPSRSPIVKLATFNADNDSILLTVADNGLGIKESDKSKAFKMFKRLHYHVEGTGIGLSIVKKIVDNNGGKIEIESEEGKGATFKVYLKNQIK